MPEKLFPPEIEMHVSRLPSKIVNYWKRNVINELNTHSIKTFTLSADYIQTMYRTVENGLIQNSEFLWMTAKYGIIQGNLDRVMDFAWKDQHPGVRAQVALALSFKGQIKEALELLKAAEKEAEKRAALNNNDLVILIEIYGIRSFALTVQKRFQEAIGEYLKAKQIVTPEEESWFQIAQVRHAYSLLKLSFVPEAILIYEKVFGFAQKKGNRYYIAQALTGLGHSFERQGKTKLAIEKYFLALESSKSINAILISSIILNRIGISYAWKKKQLNDSMDYFRQAIAAAQEGGSTWLEFGPMANLAIVKKLKGAFFEASELFEAVRDRSQIIGNLNDQLFAYMNLADIYKELGDIKQAKENKKIAQALAKHIRKNTV